MGEEVHVRHRGDRFVFPACDCRLLPIHNTSSELLAQYLCGQFRARLAERLPGLRPSRLLVTVQESPGQSAVYELIPEDA